MVVSEEKIVVNVNDYLLSEKLQHLNHGAVLVKLLVYMHDVVILEELL